MDEFVLSEFQSFLHHVTVALGVSPGYTDDNSVGWYRDKLQVFVCTHANEMQVINMDQLKEVEILSLKGIAHCMEYQFVEHVIENKGTVIID
jgi:hypothetical protein